MKTTPECWQALMDGETLTNGYSNVRLNEKDELVYGDSSPASWSFARPQDWSIYTPPKWYDNIPDGGVLCWHDDGVSIIYNKSGMQFITHRRVTIPLATPLTKQEIQRLLDNAPEGEN